MDKLALGMTLVSIVYVLAFLGVSFAMGFIKIKTSSKKLKDVSEAKRQPEKSNSKPADSAQKIKKAA